ncbi:hypothetical protein B0T26DRAFT_694981 [Lasiosphaeria miniovina]|uniref:Uncharacterized protein n=1 Tax=Lasiosphaeria miniovina TaxID=1954250 RepID=A0AA40B4U5_9PEZI|nr:uncharacterized protein B0T26DRAFT_694981 [Lasiosphaeria miniovina]KAK0727562.1 hypothetical protein B0T26DRAFT_694981 [Lasiosphaeria miniovina]
MQITRWATDLLVEQHRRITFPTAKTPGRPLPPCTEQFSSQYGLPCAHMLLERFEEDHEDGVLVNPIDCDRTWHLKKHRDAENRYLRLQQPDKAVAKGRPTNQGGPFGNEDILPPVEPPAPKTKTTARSGTISRDARRYYSQFELAGPSLEEQDEQDEQDEEELEVDSDCIVVTAVPSPKRGRKRKATTQQRGKGKKRKTTKTAKTTKTVSRPARVTRHITRASQAKTPGPDPHIMDVAEWQARRVQRRQAWENAAHTKEENEDFDSGDEDDPFPRKKRDEEEGDDDDDPDYVY